MSKVGAAAWGGAHFFLGSELKHIVSNKAISSTASHFARVSEPRQCSEL